MEPHSFYIILPGVLTELAVLAVIFYAYFREPEREKHLLLWSGGFVSIFLGDLASLLFYSEILKHSALEQFFQILATFVFAVGAFDVKLTRKFKWRALFFALIPVIVAIIVLSETVFMGKWAYTASLVLIPPVSISAGLRMIPQSRVMGMVLILWGLLPFARFAVALESFLTLREVVGAGLGFAVLVLILDRYRTKAVHVERLYHTVVDAMNEALVLLDTDEKIIYINNRFADMMRCKNRQELIGKSFLDFVPERFKETVIQKTEMRKMGVCDSYEIELKDFEGNIHNVIVSGAPYYDESGNFAGTIGVILDITEKRKLEIDYQLASKLAAIGELAAGIAHNIKNPLQGIIFVAELLKRRGIETQLVDMLMKQAGRINEIITNLQFKAVMDSRMEVQVFDLNTILKEELTFLQAHRFFKHEIEKDFQFTDEPLPVRGIYSDFSQIFSNIIKNAIDAMYRTERKVLTVKTRRDDGFAIVEISDTGVGIPDDILPRIWDMFFTTKPTIYSGKRDEPVGTGIGLATVKRLLEKYNALVEVKTKVGEGTTFILKFPLANEQNQRGEA